MELLSRAEDGLGRSRSRLFDQRAIDPLWVASVDDFPERENMMESFASKFNRFQDMLEDKLLPLLLSWKGEKTGAFIDNLNRAERLHLNEVEGKTIIQAVHGRFGDDASTLSWAYFRKRNIPLLHCHAFVLFFDSTEICCRNKFGILE